MIAELRNWLAQVIDRIRGRVERAEERVNPDTPPREPRRDRRGS